VDREPAQIDFMPVADDSPQAVVCGVVVPPEVSLRKAAEILGVDPKTATKYLRAGMLQWRDIAPPGSVRPTYRIKLESVIAIRNGYRSDSPDRLERTADRRRHAPQQRCGYKLKHVTLRR
jgi:hypothetical protein